MNTDEKILKALEDLQVGQKVLQADVKYIKTEHGKDIKALKEDVKTLDQKVELIRDQNKKEHLEIMDALVGMNESNHNQLSQDLKKLEHRVADLEKHLHSSKN